MDTEKQWHCHQSMLIIAHETDTIFIFGKGHSPIPPLGYRGTAPPRPTLSLTIFLPPSSPNLYFWLCSWWHDKLGLICANKGIHIHSYHYKFDATENWDVHCTTQTITNIHLRQVGIAAYLFWFDNNSYCISRKSYRSVLSVRYTANPCLINWQYAEISGPWQQKTNRLPLRTIQAWTYVKLNSQLRLTSLLLFLQHACRFSNTSQRIQWARFDCTWTENQS